MQYRIFGRTNESVSEIGHGLWGMGGWSGSNREESLNALRQSVMLGCTFFDSAWAYGDGYSDALLGDLVKEFPGKKFFIASKIPPKNLKWPASSEDKLNDVFPKDHVFEYTEKILEANGTDSVDLLQFHVWDDAWANDDTWKQTVTELKAQGLIKSFGLSLNRWQPMNGAVAIKTGLVDSVQVIYNIFDQAPEDELFPLCKELNVGVIARVPLDEGGLTGELTLDTKFPETDWRAKYFGPENLGPTVKRAEDLKKILPEDMSLPEMALRFILSNPIVSTTIVGMRKMKHVANNISVSDGHFLSAELLDRLKEHRWDREVTPWAN